MNAFAKGVLFRVPDALQNIRNNWGILIITFLAMCSSWSFGQTGTINTFAGNGTDGNGGDNGSALSASVANPGGLAFDSKGNLYIVTSPAIPKVRKVDVNGIITTFAGTGVNGFSGDNGPAISAQLNYPLYVAVDSKDNVYVSDASNHRIRKIDTNGVITTFAGNGTGGFGGDNGPATLASLYAPWGLSFDRHDNLFIADHVNNRIRKIDTNGIITTIAGIGTIGYSGDNGLAINAQLYHPSSVVVDAADVIYIADWENNRIRTINDSGIITTIAGNGGVSYNGDGIPATSAELAAPYSIVLDQQNDIYIADAGNSRIRKISSSNGLISTTAGTGVHGFSGDNGPADSAEIYLPEGLTLDRCDNLYISEVQNKRVRKVTFHPNCFPESVNEVRTGNDIVIYPNPAKEQLTITGTSLMAIAVMNAIGQVLIAQKNYNSNKAIVNVSSLAAGVYFIRVSDKNGNVVTKRFVKE
ncbi:MAG: T9SS type A sorting domain-containing protein [Bacteroidetes bacterium]|nr:T9SS type A sorting domain-containing protein [Bacteroidota bacterium]